MRYLTFIVVLFLTGCSLFQDPTIKVKYTVDGSFSKALITHTNEAGGDTTVEVDLPWSTTFLATESGAYSVFASGQSGQGESDWITARASKDGKRKEESTSEGENAAAYAGFYWNGER